MAREQYVRPPIVAREPASRKAAVWRVRVVGVVLAVLTLIALLWLGLRLTNVTGGEDPGLHGLQPPSGSLSSAFVPLGSAGSSTS